MKSPLYLVPLALLALAGCNSGKQAEPAGAATETAAAQAPDAKPGIMVMDGTLTLPVIKDRPGAVYFTVVNGSEKPVTLAAVTIEGVGKAEMHETKGGQMSPIASLELQPGETVKFEAGGKHIMAFDVAKTVVSGGETEMTLTFAGGDKVSTPIKVKAIGGDVDASEMDGMGHGEPR